MVKYGTEEVDAMARTWSGKGKEETTPEVLLPFSYANGLVRELANNIWMQKKAKVGTQEIH